MTERKYYIDNLRWLAILLLFPFHAAQIWNGGEYAGFYIWSNTNTLLNVFSTAVYPWYMTLLFVLAGMSSKYSLQTRTNKQFVAERVKKLLFPFAFGVLFIVPIMTYVAEVFFNGYKGSYLEQYILFFTKPTNLTGYHGGFTPGHLWFLLYLFVIALLSLGLIQLQKKHLPKFKIEKTSYLMLVLLFVPEWLMQYVLNIGGKSVGQFLFLYLVGYYLFSEENIMQKIKKHRFMSMALWIGSGCIYTYLYCFVNFRGILCTGLYIFFGWLGILTLLGIGQAQLNYTNKVFRYFSSSAYPVYIIHLPVLVVTGYFVLKLNVGIPVQFASIVFISFAITMLFYEIVKRIPFVHSLFGIAKPTK